MWASSRRFLDKVLNPLMGLHPDVSIVYELQQDAQRLLDQTLHAGGDTEKAQKSQGALDKDSLAASAVASFVRKVQTFLSSGDGSLSLHARTVLIEFDDRVEGLLRRAIELNTQLKGYDLADPHIRNVDRDNLLRLQRLFKKLQTIEFRGRIGREDLGQLEKEKTLDELQVLYSSRPGIDELAPGIRNLTQDDLTESVRCHTDSRTLWMLSATINQERSELLVDKVRQANLAFEEFEKHLHDLECEIDRLEQSIAIFSDGFRLYARLRSTYEDLTKEILSLLP